MKDIAQMSQVGYERLLNSLAEVLQTQRRFIKIEREERIDSTIVHYTVKKQGTFYRYLVVVMEVGNRILIDNRGLII